MAPDFFNKVDNLFKGFVPKPVKKSVSKNEWMRELTHKHTDAYHTGLPIFEASLKMRIPLDGYMPTVEISSTSHNGDDEPLEEMKYHIIILETGKRLVSERQNIYFLTPTSRFREHPSTFGTREAKPVDIEDYQQMLDKVDEAEILEAKSNPILTIKKA